MSNFQQRMISGVVMSALALGALIVGGDIFFTLLAILTLICCYEAYLMLGKWPEKAIVISYIVLGFASAYFFREYFGWMPFFAIALVITLSDIGAYFVGSRVGGPKLCPKISPKKTWSGGLGGLIIAVAVTMGLLTLPFFQSINNPNMMVALVVVAVSAQLGDLFESFLKRRAGIKDSSSMIPGHGGFFDRLDSWIGAFFVIGAIQFIWRIIA